MINTIIRHIIILFDSGISQQQTKLSSAYVNDSALIRRLGVSSSFTITRMIARRQMGQSYSSFPVKSHVFQHDG